MATIIGSEVEIGEDGVCGIEVVPLDDSFEERKTSRSSRNVHFSEAFGDDVNLNSVDATGISDYCKRPKQSRRKKQPDADFLGMGFKVIASETARAKQLKNFDTSEFSVIFAGLFYLSFLPFLFWSCNQSSTCTALHG